MTAGETVAAGAPLIQMRYLRILFFIPACLDTATNIFRFLGC